MPITTYFNQLILNTAFLQAPFPAIDFYVGLWNSAVEVSDANYQRIPVAFELSGSKVINKANKEFPAAASYYTYNKYVLHDAASGGNQLDSYTVGATTIVPGQKVTIDAGDIWFYIN